MSNSSLSTVEVLFAFREAAVPSAGLGHRRPDLAQSKVAMVGFEESGLEEPEQTLAQTARQRSSLPRIAESDLFCATAVQQTPWNLIISLVRALLQRDY